MKKSTLPGVGAIDHNRPPSPIVAIARAGGSGEPPLPAHRDRL